MIRRAIVTALVSVLLFAAPVQASEPEFGNPEPHHMEHNPLAVAPQPESIPAPQPDPAPVPAPTPPPPVVLPCLGTVTYEVDHGVDVDLAGSDCPAQPGDWFINEVNTFNFWAHDSDWLHNPFPTHDGDFDLVWFDANGETDRVPAEILVIG